MSLASDLERVTRKLAKYHAEIDQVREIGLYTRDPAEIEEIIQQVFKLERKARSSVKELPPAERRLDIARAYAELHRAGESAIRSMLELRAELLMSNVSASLRIDGASAPTRLTP